MIRKSKSDKVTERLIIMAVEKLIEQYDLITVRRVVSKYFINIAAKNKLSREITDKKRELEKLTSQLKVI